MNWLYLIPVFLTIALVWSAIVVFKQRAPRLSRREQLSKLEDEFGCNVGSAGSLAEARKHAERLCPRIVCAANRHLETGRIICAPRHFDPIMRAQIHASEGFPHWHNCEQGFVDQFGNFLTREEARKIAEFKGQIIHSLDTGDTTQLFSEHLY